MLRAGAVDCTRCGHAARTAADCSRSILQRAGTAATRRGRVRLRGRYREQGTAQVAATSGQRLCHPCGFSAAAWRLIVKGEQPAAGSKLLRWRGRLGTRGRLGVRRRIGRGLEAFLMKVGD